MSGSAATAAADGPAIGSVLRGASAFAFLGAGGLLLLLRQQHAGLSPVR